MIWIHDVKGAEYEQLLTVLFQSCDTVQCVVREDMGDFFEEIDFECVDMRHVMEWPLTKQGGGAAPVLQYTFRSSFHTADFFKRMRPSLFSWDMPYPEDLSFWKGDDCLFAACSHEQYVKVASCLEKKLSFSERE